MTFRRLSVVKAQERISRRNLRSQDVIVAAGIFSKLFGGPVADAVTSRPEGTLEGGSSLISGPINVERSNTSMKLMSREAAQNQATEAEPQSSTSPPARTKPPPNPRPAHLLRSAKLPGINEEAEGETAPLVSPRDETLPRHFRMARAVEAAGGPTTHRISGVLLEGPDALGALLSRHGIDKNGTLAIDTFLADTKKVPHGLFTDESLFTLYSRPLTGAMNSFLSKNPWLVDVKDKQGNTLLHHVVQNQPITEENLAAFKDFAYRYLTAKTGFFTRRRAILNRLGEKNKLYLTVLHSASPAHIFAIEEAIRKHAKLTPFINDIGVLRQALKKHSPASLAEEMGKLVPPETPESFDQRYARQRHLDLLIRNNTQAILKQPKTFARFVFSEPTPTKLWLLKTYPKIVQASKDQAYFHLAQQPLHSTVTPELMKEMCSLLRRGGARLGAWKKVDRVLRARAVDQAGKTPLEYANTILGDTPAAAVYRQFLAEETALMQPADLLKHACSSLSQNTADKRLRLIDHIIERDATSLAPMLTRRMKERLFRTAPSKGKNALITANPDLTKFQLPGRHPALARAAVIAVPTDPKVHTKDACKQFFRLLIDNNADFKINPGETVATVLQRMLGSEKITPATMRETFPGAGPRITSLLEVIQEKAQ